MDHDIPRNRRFGVAARFTALNIWRNQSRINYQRRRKRLIYADQPQLWRYVWDEGKLVDHSQARGRTHSSSFSEPVFCYDEVDLWRVSTSCATYRRAYRLQVERLTGPRAFMKASVSQVQ